MNKQRKERHYISSEMKPLAELVYNKAIREQIEKRITIKYSKRIDHLVGANNELMYELEQCEKECYGRGVQSESATTR